MNDFKIGSDDYLMDQTDMVIAKLVKEKEHLIKAYNYYQGFRDKYQFAHLEKNYGVGNPTSVKFTPLIRKHIDAIVGEYLSTKIQPKISCKDTKTLTNIMRDKQLEVEKKNFEFAKKFLTSGIYNAINGKPQQNQQAVDSVIEEELKAIRNAVDLHFVSNYEIAAQNIIQYVLQSRRIDFKNKLQQLILDKLIAGESYYQVLPTASKKNFSIEVYDPMNTFVFKSPDSKYMKNGTMSVVRKWLTREEIGIKYGKNLSKQDLKDLDSYTGYSNDEERLTWIAAVNSRGCARTKGILAGVEVSNYYDENYSSDIELIPVYDVEWIDYDRNKQKGVLYHVTRIGADIYILHGENEYVSRSQDDPDNVRLSINGMYYTNRTGVPYSLMLATADLQDLYDLTLFQKDNLIAQSGTKGAHVDMSQLPTWLGDTPQERLLKYLGYRKMGLSPIAAVQDGIDQSPLNNIWNGYDDTLPVNAIQGYQLSLEMIENMASSITGVFRERLGGIQPRDAVTNVEAGMQQSYIITKQYYQAMDTLVAEILVDALDLAKIVYKKGFTGELILGNRKNIFTLLPEHYSFTDYDIHLADSTEIIKEMELLKQVALQLASQSQVDPEILLIVTTSKSLTEMNEAVRKSIREKKIENNQLQQLTQQLEQAQNQVNQLQAQLEKSTKQITQLNDKKLAIEQQDNQMRQQIDWFKAQTDRQFKETQVEAMREKNKLEAAQLLDTNPNNDEVDDDSV